MASDTPVIDCGGRRIPVRVGELHALFDPFFLQRKQEMLIELGYFTLPSILSDSTLSCYKAFYLDAHLTAYRLYDAQWQTTFYLSARGRYRPEGAGGLYPGSQPCPQS